MIRRWQSRPMFRVVDLATILFAALPGATVAVAAATTGSDSRPIEITVSATDTGTAFPHYWETMFGSGRAVLALRDNYRKDLRLVKSVTDFKYVRFHAIFHDEVGLYDEDASGKAVYNFSYVDQIYDGLLAEGVRPFVELSFMPQKLAANPKNIFGFWYKPIISPPKDYARWDDMLEAFARHLIERYGIDEVASWYFEVWNEPNIGFWGGNPYKSTYYTLYDHSARALKRVNERLRVGGPSTAQAAWAGDFIEHCQRQHVPVDFVSSHVYANDSSENVFHSKVPIARDQMVCRAVRKVSDEIKHSSQPNLPLIWSEYNASYANEPNITDTVYMGPWLATTISQCDGLTQAMSYWTFSDVFEENGVVKTPFYGGFGLVAVNQIPKPAYNAFTLLHRLGEIRLKAESDSVLVTKRQDGTLVLALWNYAPPDATGEKYVAPGVQGPSKDFSLHVNGAAMEAKARIWRLDRERGNVIAAFDAMGRPPFPKRMQWEELRTAARLAEPDIVQLNAGNLRLAIPPQGLALVEIR
jgi:xylan 1,4-beta-xylosidase